MTLQEVHPGAPQSAGAAVPAQANTHSLAERLGEALVHRGWSLGTAESCTGGLLAGAITSVPGCSAWFDRGFVTYSNEAKIAGLAVSPATLNHFGAVSEPVALEMAHGVLLSTPAAYVAIATTGLAGPDGATPGKPVGMVCFGFAMRVAEGISSRAVTHVFPGDRRAVREAAVDYALRGALEFIGTPAGSR